jgi:membrane associated rhomboid family serine protease
MAQSSRSRPCFASCEVFAAPSVFGFQLSTFRVQPPTVFPLYDENRRHRTPVVVFLFIILCVGLTIYEYVLSEAALERFLRTWAMTPAHLRLGASREVWLTTVTSMFLHGGLAHLAGNCWFLWIFGNNVEDRLGHVRFVLFYLLTGLAAAAAQFVADPGSRHLMLGASGAISGVLGAYLRHFPKAIIITLTPLWFAPLLPIPAFVFIVLWFAFQIWSGLGSIGIADLSGGVAWWAHCGGFLAGFFLAQPLAPRKKPARPKS